MDPLDFLETSLHLAGIPNRAEADNRTILSRIYYAFFLALRDGLASRDRGFAANVRNAGSDHALVRDYLKGTRYTTAKERRVGAGARVGWYERYDDLFKWREQADYVMNTEPAGLAGKVDEFMADVPTLRPLIEIIAGRSKSS